MTESVRESLSRAVRAAVVFLGHLALMLIVLLGLRGTQWVFACFWHNANPMFFDRIPVKWFFDACDIGVLTVFALRGIVDAYNQMTR